VAGKWDEKRISEASGSFWQACTLQGAVKLDLFSLLGREGKTSGEMAAATGSDLRGITAILDALSAMALIVKKEQVYFNTDDSSRLLDRNSKDYIGWRVLHHHYLLPSWARLDEAVLQGRPSGDERENFNAEDQRQAFLMAMFNNASSVSPDIVPYLELGEPSSLLDLGGGPGTYAVEFCRRHSALEAVVFDLPGSRPYAEATIRNAGLENRIHFEGGDFFIDDIPGKYDVVWLSHVIHSSGPEEAQRVISKAAGALKTGGRMLIHDFWLNEAGDGPLFPALFALNMLVRTPKGRSYRESEGREMLDRAGLVQIRRLDLQIPNDSGVLEAIKA